MRVYGYGIGAHHCHIILPWGTIDSPSFRVRALDSAPTMDPVPSAKAGSSFLYMHWLVRVPELDRHFSPLNQVAHHSTSQVTIDSIHQHIITLNHIPSGNQTWQSTIAHVWMILPFNPAFYGGFPLAMFNYQRVTCHNLSSISIPWSYAPKTFGNRPPTFLAPS